MEVSDNEKGFIWHAENTPISKRLIENAKQSINTYTYELLTEIILWHWSTCFQGDVHGLYLHL